MHLTIRGSSRNSVIAVAIGISFTFVVLTSWTWSYFKHLPVDSVSSKESAPAAHLANNSPLHSGRFLHDVCGLSDSIRMPQSGASGSISLWPSLRIEHLRPLTDQFGLFDPTKMPFRMVRPCEEASGLPFFAPSYITSYRTELVPRWRPASRPSIPAPSHPAFVVQEAMCMAQALYHEARGEGELGQEAVAEVIMNRVRAVARPKTICGVIREPHQFAFMRDGSMKRSLEPKEWDRSLKLAERILRGHVTAITQHATFFHATYIQPRWTKGMVRTVQIGNHVFYRL